MYRFLQYVSLVFFAISFLVATLDFHWGWAYIPVALGLVAFGGTVLIDLKFPQLSPEHQQTTPVISK